MGETPAPSTALVPQTAAEEVEAALKPTCTRCHKQWEEGRPPYSLSKPGEPKRHLTARERRLLSTPKYYCQRCVNARGCLVAAEDDNLCLYRVLAMAEERGLRQSDPAAFQLLQAQLSSFVKPEADFSSYNPKEYRSLLQMQKDGAALVAACAIPKEWAGRERSAPQEPTAESASRTHARRAPLLEQAGVGVPLPKQRRSGPLGPAEEDPWESKLSPS